MTPRMQPPLLREILSEFAAELKSVLELTENKDLIPQIDSLRIVDRCRCGDDFCGTFQTAPSTERSAGSHRDSLELDTEEGLVVLNLVNRKIVSVEVLFREEITKKLKASVP